MYHPASLRSDGGRPRLEGVATFPWSTWQASLGMSGNLPVDSVATFPWIGWQKSVEYANKPMKQCFASFSGIAHKLEETEVERKFFL